MSSTLVRIQVIGHKVGKQAALLQGKSLAQWLAEAAWEKAVREGLLPDDVLTITGR